MHCSLYNYAVAQMRQAVYMELDQEGIKKACIYFQQCAWVFEYLTSQVGTLKQGKNTLDFAKEALMMCHYLCLAQAQYLFYRKARDASMSPAMLAKTCAQTSVYFKKAFEANQINPLLANYDKG